MTNLVNLQNFVLLKFCYVDDSLALIKESGIGNVLSKLNGFHPSLIFTVDKFVMFKHNLDLKVIDNEIYICYKHTHTGQYIQFSRYTPQNIKTPWIKAMYNRATKICSNLKLLDDEMKKILEFMSWNGFPNYVSKLLLNHSKSNSIIHSNSGCLNSNVKF